MYLKMHLLDMLFSHFWSHIHIIITFSLHYHWDRLPTSNIWVFGMVDTSKTPSLGHLCLASDWSRVSLLPIIQAQTLPGTIIYSDDFSTYRNAVGQLPSMAQHQTVNHSLNFVDLVTGVHMQHVESYWNQVKQKFKQMMGVQESQLSSYLDEFMRRER